MGESFFVCRLDVGTLKLVMWVLMVMLSKRFCVWTVEEITIIKLAIIIIAQLERGNAALLCRE